MVFHGSLEYTGSYFATKPQFASIAIVTAQTQCNASMYSTICDRIGSLPPYICTRKQNLPFFTVFATAIANAHLLTVIMFVVCGVTLARLNKVQHGANLPTTRATVEMTESAT